MEFSVCFNFCLRHLFYNDEFLDTKLQLGRSQHYTAIKKVKPWQKIAFPSILKNEIE